MITRRMGPLFPPALAEKSNRAAHCCAALLMDGCGLLLVYVGDGLNLVFLKEVVKGLFFLFDFLLV